jgi:hypothetical protein
VQQEPIVDELNEEYGDRIEFIKLNVKDDADANCEFYRQELESTPSMLYIDIEGNLVETTDMRLEKEELKAKLENLLK